MIDFSFSVVAVENIFLKFVPFLFFALLSMSVSSVPDASMWNAVDF